MVLETQKRPQFDAKPKIESKPIVENKPEGEPARKPAQRWILFGFAALVLIVAGAAFYAIPQFGETGRASGEQVKGKLALEPFLVNLADKDESRFVKGTFHLGLAEKLSEKEKDSAAVAAIRDSIITLLSSKTADQILTPQGKDTLREEIRARVSTISPQIKVLEVYIVDFVVQL